MKCLAKYYSGLCFWGKYDIFLHFSIIMLVMAWSLLFQEELEVRYEKHSPPTPIKIKHSLSGNNWRQYSCLVGLSHISRLVVVCLCGFMLVPESLDKNTRMYQRVAQTYFCSTLLYTLIDLYFLAIELLIEKWDPREIVKCLYSPWGLYSFPFFLWNNNHCNILGRINICSWGMHVLQSGG